MNEQQKITLENIKQKVEILKAHFNLSDYEALDLILKAYKQDNSFGTNIRMVVR